MLAPNQIRGYHFQMAGEGLYRADEVDSFVATVGSSYEKLYNDNGDMIKRINMLAEKVKEYKDEEELIKKTLLVAQKKADEIESSSRQQSDALLADAQKRAQDTAAAAEKRSKDLTAASEERARTTLAQAKLNADAILKGASETAEKTLATARSKATMMLTEAKARADKMLADAQAKSNDILGSLKEETENEKNALETVRAQSKAFRDQLLASYDEQRAAAAQMLAFADADDDLAENAVQAAADVTQIEAPEPVELPAEETPAEVQAPAVEDTTPAAEDDDLFIAAFAEAIDSAAEQEPQAETVAAEPVAEAPAAEEPAAPAEPEPQEETGGFSFVQSFDSFVSQQEPVVETTEEIPEVELADIDEIFSSALSAPAEPEHQEPEIDLSSSIDELREKYRDQPAPQAEPDAAFGGMTQDAFDYVPEEPTQVVTLGEAPQEAPQETPAAPAPQEDKPEKKHRRFSLFSRYADDDEDDEDDDEDEDDEEDDEDDEDFRGFFRK